MNEISAKYFSTKFIIENELKLADIVILEYIYSWILSNNPPEFKMESGKKAFYLSQSHIANDYNSLIDQSTVSRKIRKLEKCGIVETRIIDSVKGKFYLCFNWDKVVESLAPQPLLEQQKYKYCSNWFEKIFQYIKEEQQAKEEWNKQWNEKSWHEKIEYEKQQEQQWKQQQADSYNRTNEENMAGLLNDKDMQLQKLRYSKQADSIAKRILTKYAQYFQNKIPQAGQQPTKTYTRLCQKIDDIYNGHFVSSRFYNFNDGVFNNKQFDTEGWQDKIKAVKNDWTKVKQLIFHAVDNFRLMYDEDRMPMKKDYLTNNLNDWFFSDNPNSKGQSHFIQSLNEPQIQKEKLGTDKAKFIVEEIKSKSPVSYLAGHELNELLPANANEASAWTFIQEIIKWGKLLFQYDENAKYFLQCEIENKLQGGPKVLPALFARYLKEKEISVSLNTLNIEQAMKSNGPWCWFMQEACKKHSLNPNCLECLDDADFFDAYNNNVSFDDMEEVPIIF